MLATRPLEVQICKSDAVVVVHVGGDAGVHNVDELERHLRPVMAMRPSLVVIDLSALSFVSSLGLGLMVELSRGVHRNGGHVRFAAAQPSVRDTIVKCRLDDVLALFPSVDAALDTSDPPPCAHPFDASERPPAAAASHPD
jgi:anti-anti-sigma factor